MFSALFDALLEMITEREQRGKAWRMVLMGLTVALLLGGLVALLVARL
jgi:hypothetical protein